MDTSVYDAMNKGIENANGEWLYFLGDDDKLVSPDTLAKVFADKAYRENKLLIGNISYNYSNADSYFLKKNDGTLKPSWSFKLWIKNSLHHQGLFYKNTLFKNANYALEYGILSDYHFNLGLYKKQIKVSYLNQVIAICGTNGISKKYDWKTYKEEIQLKVSRSSKILQPLFFGISFLKYLVKKKI